MTKHQTNPCPKGSVWSDPTTGSRVKVTSDMKADAEYINRLEKVDIKLLDPSLPLLTGTIDLGDLLDGYTREGGKS